MVNTDIEILSSPEKTNMADDWYQYASAEHFWFQWRFSKVRMLLRSLELGDRVIEVGCGNGTARDQLEEYYDRPIDGCDLSLYALEQAGKGRGKLYVYDVHQRRPEWERFFDSVFLLDTLEHIEDTTGFLASIRYHLKEDGLLIVNVPALQSLHSRFDEAAGHVKRYNPKTLREELSSAGFCLVRYSYWGSTMLPIAYLRKIVTRFARREHIIRQGIQPTTKLADCLLRFLMRTEMLLCPSPWVGTSIAAVAQKMEHSHGIRD